MKAIINALIYEHQAFVKERVIIFEDNIERIISNTEFEANKETRQIEVIDGNGKKVIPGFIDIHIHGACGCDVMDGDLESIQKIAEGVVTTGTTAFLATTMTMSQERIDTALQTTRDFMKLQSEKYVNAEAAGAQIVGVHLEGPFINPIFKGAQSESHIQKPTNSWILPNMDIVKMITYAPEMDPDFEFAKALRGTDIVLSIGHSGGDFEMALKAYDEGVRHVTHCFNAMTGLHHRKPGIIGAILTKPFTMDIISDGIHVHPGFIGAFIKQKGIDQTILITDAMRAALMPEGEYDLGGQKVFVKDNSCKLEDGTLAGSVLTTGQALKNMVRFSDIPLERIIDMLTINPAKLLKLESVMGTLEEGKLANIVLLDESNNINSVYVKGICHFGGK